MSREEAWDGAGYEEPPRVRTQKVRGGDVWRQVRRAWEGGETAQSCARRFDVGLDNLWRRRAKENWSRTRPEDPTPEPAVGWERHAAQLKTVFEARLAEVRELALHLADTLAGREIEDVSAWHLGFLFHQRAERLGPGTAEADRARVTARGDDWAGDVWDAEGRLRPLWEIDQALMRRWRDDWRAEQGLPEGVATDVP